MKPQLQIGSIKANEFLPITLERSAVIFVLSIFFILLSSCKTIKPASRVVEEQETVTFKIIQLNDVYEIAPLSGGQYGGMARVAHVRDSVAKVNPNTYLVMAGDFLNPSLLGTIKVNGERINGEHMIEVMNAMNFDLVTFGNHEFDVGEKALQKRLDESNFQWTSANVKHKMKNGSSPFVIQRNNRAEEVNNSHIIVVDDGNGGQLKVGFFSVTLPSNPVDFVDYGDIFSEAEKAYHSLEKNVDIVIGLTHLKIEQDIALTKRLPKLQFIMGGHEHYAMLVPSDNAIIAKADANAKSVYIHTLEFNKVNKNLKIDSHLFPIDEKIASEPNVAEIVDKWNAVLEKEINEVVSNSKEVIYRATTPLDGTDSANRGIQTNLGDLVTAAMADSFNEPVDGALVNAGSFRIDDILAGNITGIDIFRVLPFGGNIVKVEMTGNLLVEVLNFGKLNDGTGAYLQRHDIEESKKAGWLIAGRPIDTKAVYTIAMSDFLMRGYDIPFLTKDNKEVISVYQPKPSEAASDIRKAVILYLKKLNK
ncbi:MAG: 5'-nucleotidase/UDP-sugar diphosphatase [Sediminicola sp.]|mgnify:CR=1 FL=1|jgi:2',3'-cyclic-nucleotide 2'-phosphodiesterase (5'-nucleotidase family)